jgi:hypothetical protein
VGAGSEGFRRPAAVPGFCAARERVERVACATADEDNLVERFVGRVGKCDAEVAGRGEARAVSGLHVEGDVDGGDAAEERGGRVVEAVAELLRHRS